MARIMFVLVSVACMLQTLAAPLRSRAATSAAAPDCSTRFDPQTLTGMTDALNTLGAINAGNEAAGGGIALLQTETSLANVLFDTTTPPLPDINGRAATAIQSALGTLDQFSTSGSFFGATIPDAIASANSSLTTALASAQLASKNCNLNATATGVTVTATVTATVG
ncbi:hypothetical protein B0H11DRAFT_1993647 [Mycena galericulata]|nr:hypothetical protein B0H11DRAFT_1993647 [Mycena galericulata]